MHILIIEDSETIGDFYGLALDHSYDLATTPQRALTYLQNHYDAIIADINVCNRKIWEFLDGDNCKNSRVILVSGGNQDSIDDAKEKLINKGVDVICCLMKPIYGRELKKCLRKN